MVSALIRYEHSEFGPGGELTVSSWRKHQVQVTGARNVNEQAVALRLEPYAQKCRVDTVQRNRGK